VEILLNNRLMKAYSTNYLSGIFNKLSNREDLTHNEAKDVVIKIFDDLVHNKPGAPALMIAFYGSLTVKEPALEELTGMADALERTKKFKFHFDVKKPLVTAGGTGGDTISTINVTTPATIVAASAGAYALKSGARAFSSKTGASDLAYTLGVNINSSKRAVEECVEKIGTTIWDSGGVYPWMDPLIELGSRNETHLISPLLYSLRLMIATGLNPFSIKRQVRGVSRPFTEKIARVLLSCNYEKALVVLGYGKTEDMRIDEYSNLGKNVISELKPNGIIETYCFFPEDIGLKRGNINEIMSFNSHEENAKIVVKILSGLDSYSRTDIVLLNAGAILYLADEVKDIKDGYELSKQILNEGKAIKKLKQLISLSGGLDNKLKRLINSF